MGKMEWDFFFGTEEVTKHILLEVELIFKIANKTWLFGQILFKLQLMISLSFASFVSESSKLSGL